MRRRATTTTRGEGCVVACRPHPLVLAEEFLIEVLLFLPHHLLRAEPVPEPTAAEGALLLLRGRVLRAQGLHSRRRRAPEVHRGDQLQNAGGGAPLPLVLRHEARVRGAGENGAAKAAEQACMHAPVKVADVADRRGQLAGGVAAGARCRLLGTGDGRKGVCPKP